MEETSENKQESRTPTAVDDAPSDRNRAPADSVTPLSTAKKLVPKSRSSKPSITTVASTTSAVGSSVAKIQKKTSGTPASRTDPKKSAVTHHGSSQKTYTPAHDDDPPLQAFYCFDYVNDTMAPDAPVAIVVAENDEDATGMLDECLFDNSLQPSIMKQYTLVPIVPIGERAWLVDDTERSAQKAQIDVSIAVEYMNSAEDDDTIPDHMNVYYAENCVHTESPNLSAAIATARSLERARSLILDALIPFGCSHPERVRVQELDTTVKQAFLLKNKQTPQKKTGTKRKFEDVYDDDAFPEVARQPRSRIKIDDEPNSLWAVY